ncbi:dihydropteroate synthase [Kiritimatiellaeota bacterium B1221]|nr:dihydropteroate synthase [Kiritimatiellaeota bacterium B1221]
MKQSVLAWKTGNRENGVSSRTLIMGVVNVTPDSFSDGGNFLDPAKAMAQGCQLVEQGADILDIGGESTRPGAMAVSADEEVRRVVPVIRGLRERFPELLLSVDTSKVAVAAAALDAGADILNDVTAGLGDAEMFPLAASSGAGLVLMHMQGKPQTMQANPTYRNVIQEVEGFFRERIAAAEAAGVQTAQIALDPGIGFGKTLDHNLELIAHLNRFQVFGCPLLLGVSRKRWLGEITGREVDNRLAASLGGAAACVSGGANILRVHDVIESCDLVRILDKVKQTRLRTTHE